MKALAQLLPIGLLELFLAPWGTEAAPTDRPRFSLDTRASAPIRPVIDRNFADPSILRGADGAYYAFATTGNGKNVQAARASAPGGPWTYLDDVDPLPDPGPWTSGKNTWAPDVRRVDDGSYVLYYSGALANHTAHCIGVATSQSITGPYTPQEQPLACPLEAGGAIDPSGFRDPASGRRYVVYKVDGNNVGHGGDCGNSVAPLVPTPLMLLALEADGVTPTGSAPVQVLDRTDADGPLVEAPNLVRTPAGKYMLLYSTHCFSSLAYNIKYAISAGGVEGPYERPNGSKPLIQTGDFGGLQSPGGATGFDGGRSLVFHAKCPTGPGRCMFGGDFGIGGVPIVFGWNGGSKPATGWA